MDSRAVSRIWWAIVLRGILAVLFGILALIYTGQTMLAIIYAFGVFSLLTGVMQLVTAVRAGEAHRRWCWLAVAGVAAGVISFVWPGITALSLLFLIAAWAFISGVAEIVFALSYPDTLAHPWLAGLSGILSIVFGFLLVVWPRSGVITLTWLVG